VQEAMASGLPVVAPAAGGPLDLVEHGRTGFLVPPHRAGGFTDAVARLAADADRRHAFGAAGRAAVRGRSWSAIGDELLAHYRHTLAATSPGRGQALVAATTRLKPVSAASTGFVNPARASSSSRLDGPPRVPSP
jgi:hypothetical protein